MSTTVTLGAVLARIRATDPRFTARRVPGKLLGLALTDVQRRLFDAAAAVNPEAVSIQTAIAFRPATLDADANATSEVGAGEAGGLPALVVDGAPQVDPSAAGWALQQDGDVDVVVLQDDRSVSSATATTITRTAAGWTVNQFVGDVVRLKVGEGAPQRREILSNTADTLTLADPFDPVPDATTVFDIVQPTLVADGTLGVVTRLPATDVRAGYLLTFDAQGQPVFDLTAPVEVAVDAGVPLPPTAHVLGGTVRYAGGAVGPLLLLSYGDRLAEQVRVQGSPSAYIAGGTFHPMGGPSAWEGVESVTLRVVPFPEPFESEDDAFLLPRTAEDALVKAGALVCAERCAALEAEQAGAGGGVTPGLVQVSQRRADEAEQRWVQSINRQRRGRSSSVREVC